MNRYKITFRFAGGPELTCIKTADTKDRARRSLYVQIGQSHRLEIISIERVEA